MAGTNVPGLDNSPQFSQNVPGVALPHRQEFGQGGRALQHVGESIEQAAHAGYEVYDEIQRQHDISTASKNYVDASVGHAQQLQNLKLTSPDGFIHDQSGEIIQNSDGSQRTISQEYWDWADGDYQKRQKEMSPRASAMFRQQMLPHIGDNTKILQNDGLLLQRQSADTDVKQSMATLARDNDRTPYPDQNAYYQDQRQDGSINLRQNTDKINEQLRTLKLWTTRQGPTDGTPGMYNPAEVDKMNAARLSDHSENWMRSAVTDILETDTPRDHKNRISTTAVQQVLNLRDIVEGKDPQSAVANSKGLPTVNSSLTSEQTDKWRAQLNGMLDGAKKIDRSDYDLQLDQMKQRKDIKSIDQLWGDPQFAYLVHAREPLGMTPEKSFKDFSEVFTHVALNSNTGPMYDLASEPSKRRQMVENLSAISRGAEQHAAMLGVNFTKGVVPALTSEVSKALTSQIEEESRQFKEDPAKFAAQPASGYQDYTKGITYRSKMMKGVEDKLFSDPSIFAMVNPMSNGKPVIVNAARSMKTIGAQGFGAGYEANFLSKDAYEAQAAKIDKSGNPEQVDKFFEQLKKVSGTDAGTAMDQLVKVGKLDQRYQIAQNLPTAQARIAAYADIMSKGAAIEAYTKTEGAETSGEIWKKAAKSNNDIIDFNNRLYGADSPEAAKANKMLLQTWASAYAANMGVKGTSQSDAAVAASDRVAAQIPQVGQVGDTHHFLGFSFGTSGPQAKIQFSRPDLNPDQQATIAQNLNTAQKEQELSKYQFVPAPISQGAYDFNKKLGAKWIAEHPFAWYPVRQGTPQAAYRLQYQGMNADGSPNSKGYDVKIHGTDGTPRFYEVPESQALLKGNH